MLALSLFSPFSTVQDALSREVAIEDVNYFTLSRNTKIVTLELAGGSVIQDSTCFLPTGCTPPASSLMVIKMAAIP